MKVWIWLFVEVKRLFADLLTSYRFWRFATWFLPLPIISVFSAYILFLYLSFDGIYLSWSRKQKKHILKITKIILDFHEFSGFRIRVSGRGSLDALPARLASGPKIHRLCRRSCSAYCKSLDLYFRCLLIYFCILYVTWFTSVFC
jgi:hypothetical protein